MNNGRLIPLINGVEHSWANIVVSIAGIPIIGIRAISYGDSQNIENIYGVGASPVARGYGNIEATASITLLRSEIEALRGASVTGRLQDLAPFDIVVTFIPYQAENLKPITHIIKQCSFTNDAMAISQGDVSNEQELTLLPSFIVWSPKKELKMYLNE